MGILNFSCSEHSSTYHNRPADANTHRHMHDKTYLHICRGRETHVTTLISHSCCSFAMKLLSHYQLIVIFSAPVIHIIWMEPLPPSLSVSAHQIPFLETAHILWGVNGFYPWVRMAYLFILSSDVPSLSKHPVSCGSLCAAKV